MPRIEIVGVQADKLDVHIHIFNAPGLTSDRVSLFIDLHTHRVNIRDLTGNGPPSEGRINNGHNQGYGTLAMHLATKVIRKWFGDNYDAPVFGDIFDKDMHEKPQRLEEIARFWRRFGLEATTPEPGKGGVGKLTGKVSDIQITSRPYKAGNVFPVDIDLSWFRVLENVGTADMNDPSERTNSRPRMP